MADETMADERPRFHRENRKKNRDRKVADNQARAVAKFVRVPPRKARLVMDQVRGRYASEALAFLRFVPNRAAVYIGKVLASAVANAANNHELNPENLKLIECRVDEGPRMKRVQPRAQGRAYRILKRTAHITVIVQEVAPKPRKPRKVVRSRAQAAREARQPQAATAPATANTADKTDEIGAPIDNAPTAPAATTPPVAESSAHSGPETANHVDTTDEIGAPVSTDAEGQP